MNYYALITSFSWREPVAAEAYLPTFGNSNGDARVTIDTQSVWIWANSQWNEVSGGGGGAASWKAPVADEASLPAMGNTAGDARAAEDTGALYGWDGSQWVQAGAGAAGGISKLAIYTSTAGQAFTGSDKVLFGTQVYDPDGLVTNAATDFNYVVAQAGTYGVIFEMLFGPIAKVGYIELAALKNDLRDHTIAARQLVNANDYDGIAAFGMIRGLIIGDKIATRLGNSTTATLTATAFAGYNRIQIFRMGD